MLGSGRRLAVEVFTSPGGYILGEESALIECMEGHRGEPRNKPPFPGIYGLWGKPTLMNSVETFADVPVIVERGAQWWKAQGVGGSRRAEVLRGLRPRRAARRLLRPDGHHGRASCSSWPAGCATARALAAVQPGGASSNFLGPDRSTCRSTSTPLAEAGSMLGSGAMVVMAEGTDLLAAATNVLRFFRDESCGKCVPCRVGLAQGAHPARRTCSSAAAALDDVDERRSLELEETMRPTSICGLGQVALGPGGQRAAASSAARAAAPRSQPRN